MSTAPAPPGATSENLLVTLMFFAAGIVFLDRFGIAYAFPFIGPDLDLNNVQLGLSISVTAFAWAISSIVFSVISDRLGGRKKLIIVTSLVVFSLATGLTGLVHSFGALLAVRALIGFAEGPALPLIQSAVVAASSEHRRGRNLGIVIAGTGFIGTALPPVLVGLLSGAIGWRPTFALIAVPGLIIAGLVAVFMKEDRSHPSAQSRLSFAGFRQALANRNVILAFIGAICLIAYAITTGAFVPLFLSKSQAFGPGEAALILTLSGLAGAASNFLMPSLSDRIGRKAAFLATALCAVLLPLIYIAGQNNLSILFLAVVFGLAANGALTIIMYVIPGESVPLALAATTFAILIAVGETIGGTAGPAIGGALADQFGLSAALIFCAALAAVSFLAGLFLRETHGRRARAAHQHHAMDIVAEEMPATEVR
jgi:predicted MFS family arabinose efflux permease